MCQRDSVHEKTTNQKKDEKLSTEKRIKSTSYT